MELAVAHPVLTGIIATVVSFAAISAVIDKVTITAQESAKALSDMQSSYDENKSELESLNSELATTQSRMDELQAKGHLTLTEQEELANLQAQNAELERTIALKEAQQKIDAKATASQAEDTYKQWTKKKGYLNKEDEIYSDTSVNAIKNNLLSESANRIENIKHDAVSSWWNKNELSGDFRLEEVNINDQKDNINYLIGTYKALQEAQENVASELDVIAAKGNNATEDELKQASALQEYYDALGQKTIDVETYMNEYANVISDTYSAYKEAESLGVITSDQKEQLKSMESFMTDYMKTVTNTAGDVETAINNIFAKSQFINLKDQLVAAGKSSEELLSGVIAKTPGLTTALDEAGVSAQQLSDYIMAIADPDSLRIDEIKKQLKDAFLSDDYEINFKVGESADKTWNDFISDKSNKEIEIFYKYINANDLDISNWNLEDLNVNWTKAMEENASDSAESFNNTFSSLLSSDTDGSLTELVDNFQSDISSIQESLDSLKTNEDIDLTDLVQQFPELASETDNLQVALAKLSADKLQEFVSSYRNSISELTNPREIAKAESFLQNVINSFDFSTSDLSNYQSLVKTNLSKAGGTGSGASPFETWKKLFNDFGDTVEGREILIKLSADPTNVYKSYDELYTMADNMELSIRLSINADTESTKSLLSQISAIKSALSSQSTGKSIDVETFNSEELKDYQSALEYVNGTMQINAEKAESIAKAKADEAIAEHEASKAQAQAKYLENAKEIDVLRESMASMDKSSQEYLDTASRISDLSLENDSIVSQCNQWDLLNDSIREATGTYQAWLNSQNVGDSGDMASDVRSAMSNINEVFDSDSEEYGRYYTPKYEAAVDFLVPEEVSSQGQDAVKKYTDNLSTYFTGDMEGAQKYVGEAIDKGLMEWSPDGESVKIAAGKTMKDFSDAFNWTDEVTQAMFGDLQTYFGQDAFSWIDESVKTIGDLGVMANEAADSLRGIEGNETLKINLDVSEFDTKEEKISALDSTIQEMNNLKAKPGVDTSEIDYANTVIQYCIAQKQQLEEPAVMSVDTSLVNGEVGNAISLLQQFQTAQNTLEMQASVGMDTTEAQANVDALVQQIQGINPKVSAELEIDTTSADSITASLATLTPEIMVKAGIDDSAIIGYTADDKEATVKYDVNKSAVDNYSPNDKNAKVIYTPDTSALPTELSPLRRAVQYYKTGDVGNNSLNGTANVSGTALVGGNWSARAHNKTGTTLIGEIAPEIVVHGDKGTWELRGVNGPEFYDLKPTDLVFNHLQSAALLERGHVFGKGSATIGGTAKVLGDNLNNSTFLSGIKGYKGSSSSTDKSSSSVSKDVAKTAKSVEKAATKVKQSLDSIIESLSKLFDWIEVRVQRYEENIDLNKAKADNATNYQSKNSYISKAQTYTKKLIDVQEQAVAKYQKQADTVAKQVGLSASLKKKVDNGTINIQSLSEDNKKRVEQYKQWVDKAKSAAQAVEDLKQQQKELAQTKLDNIVEQYESITGLAEAAQNTSKSLVDYLTSAGKEVNSNEAKNQLRSQMSQQNVITSNLQAQVNAYKTELANAAKVFGENSNEYRDASTKLQELNQSLYESQTAYNDLNKQLFELDLSRIQYAIDNISFLSDKIKNVISLNEKRGSVITEADYTNQVKNNNSLVGMYYQDWNARKAKIAQEGWLPGSEQYQEYYEAIMKDEEAIYQLLEGNEDLKASIVTLRWKPFEDLQEKLSQSIDDFDYLRGLLNEEGFFDDNGKMTSQGYANIALLGESMSTAKKQVADYRVALEKLQEEYDNVNITLDSYNERSRDYIDTIKSSISVIEDYKDALVDLYKTQITKENDALQESINLRKEALSKKKDYYDYDKQLKSKNKDINSLKAQIAALQGVTNQASIAELARLKEQLQDATDARDELVKDHEYGIKVSGYEKLSDDAQDALDKTLSELESNSQKQQEVVNMMLENIKSSYSSAYSEIQGIISNTGLVLGNEAQSAVNKLNELANAINLANSAQLAQSNVASSSQANGINTGTITTGTSNTNAIENAIGGDTAASIAQQTAIENARKAELERQRQAQEAEARARAEAEAAVAAKAKAEAEAAAKAKAEADRLAKLDKVKSIIANNSVKGKVSSSTYKSHGNLWKYIYYKSGKSYVNITRKNMVAIGKVLGVTGLPSDPLKITDAKKDEILKALKAVGYRTGTKSVPNTGNYWTHDGEIIFRKADNAVLTPLKAKDTVVPANFADNLYKWGAINPERVMPTFDQQPEFKNNNMSIVNHYDSLLTVNGDVSKDTLPSLEVILKKSYEYTSREWYKEGKKMGYR